MSAVLKRETFKTSRLLDFFTVKELTAQIGHGPDHWPLVILKELIDNAIDACEDNALAPVIDVDITGEQITVTDNGPGLPPETVAGVLDYSVRVSSREAYIGPCRGAQGNALKTLVAMPFVLDGEQGTVEIDACGVLHRITCRVDRIQQKPVLEHEQELGLVKNGTKVTIPSMPTNFDNTRILQLLHGYIFTNPHLTLNVTIDDWHDQWPATIPDWKKWRPNDPAPVQWYSVENLERLIAAYLGNDKDLPIREFVALFRGFSGSAKQKKVLDATGLARCSLSSLTRGDTFDHEAIKALMAAMCAESRSVKPTALGIIGKDHIAQRMALCGANADSFKYDRRIGETNGIPWFIENAFAYCPDLFSRELVTGVNWSPGILNPFRELGSLGQSLDSVLQELRAARDEPIVLLIHMACARVSYTDRGKSAVLMEG